MSRLRNGNESKTQYQKRMDKQQNTGRRFLSQREKVSAEEIKRIKEANIKYMKKLGII